MGSEFFVPMGGAGGYKSVWPNPSDAMCEEALQAALTGYVRLNRDLSANFDSPTEKRCAFFELAHVLNHLSGRLSGDARMFTSIPFVNETSLVQAVDAYAVDDDAIVYKRTGGGQDWFRSGMWLYQTVLVYGRMDTAHTWRAKTLAVVCCPSGSARRISTERRRARPSSPRRAR
jgi:hypothetical protein